MANEKPITYSPAKQPGYVVNTIGMDEAPVIRAFHRIANENEEAIYSAFKTAEVALAKEGEKK